MGGRLGVVTLGLRNKWTDKHTNGKGNNQQQMECPTALEVIGLMLNLLIVRDLSEVNCKV